MKIKTALTRGMLAGRVRRVLNGRYKLIYLDPPWQHRDKANAGKRGAVHKYNVMTLDQLKSFPLTTLAHRDCLLAMWWVGPMPGEALQLLDVWGFELRTFNGFTWIKSTVNGKDHFGMGNWTRANCESVLLASRGKPKRVSASVRQIVRAPVRAHSQKPDEVRDRLVQLMGRVARVELFARYDEPPAGWDVLGDEVRSTIKLIPGVKPIYTRIKKPATLADGKA